MFDIVVIGGGPGGYTAAIHAAQLGASVCLIEKQSLGGTCLNRGCIPTKALYRSAQLVNRIKHAADFGIEVPGYTIDISKIQQRKAEIVNTLQKGIAQLIGANKIEWLSGTARLNEKNTVIVELGDGTEKTIEGKNIILATGSEPILPKLFQVPGVWTSDEILQFDKLPESLAIIGGGVIGMEFACIFNELGTKVTVIEALPSILGTVDSDLIKRLMPSLKKRGIDILTSTSVQELLPVDDGFIVSCSGKKGEIEVQVQKVLAAVGRKPFVGNLGLENLAIECSPKGIEVDEDYKTNVDGIYAIGDVNGKNMLAHAAAWQGERVVDFILKNRAVGACTVPACIFIFPEIASVGMTEEEAKRDGLRYKTSRFLFGANGKALTMGEAEGFVKVLAATGGEEALSPDETKGVEKIIGVHIMGPHASDLIHEGALAVNHSMSIEDIENTIHAHPTLSEAFHEAVGGILGRAIHIAPTAK